MPNLARCFRTEGGATETAEPLDLGAASSGASAETQQTARFRGIFIFLRTPQKITGA